MLGSAPVCALAVGQAIGRIGCQLSGDGDWGRSLLRLVPRHEVVGTELGPEQAERQEIVPAPVRLEGPLSQPALRAKAEPLDEHVRDLALSVGWHVAQHACAHERVLQVQLVNAAHAHLDRKVYRSGQIVHAAPADAGQLSLTAERKCVVAV